MRSNRQNDEGVSGVTTYLVSINKAGLCNFALLPNRFLTGFMNPERQSKYSETKEEQLLMFATEHSSPGAKRVAP